MPLAPRLTALVVSLLRGPRPRLALVLVVLLALSGSGLALGVARVAPAASGGTPADPAVAKVPTGPGSTCVVTGRVPQGCRPLVGAAHGANTEPVQLEGPAGRRLGVRRTYWTGTQVDSAVRTARSDTAHGRIPWISFKLPMSWADMAAGRGDAWALDLAHRLSRVDGPVWVAFHHEPEGDGDLADWRAMQERLAPLVRRAAPNVAYSVILTGWNQLYGDRAYRFDRIWPRGVKIDIAGFDLYNEYGVTKNGRYDTRWPCMACQFYRPLQRWARSQGVAWGIAEFGWTDDAARRRPHWLRTTYREVRKAGGIAFTYFDTPYNSIASWDLSEPGKQRLFTHLVRRGPRPVTR
ncbi:hypothetical protein ABFT23_21750 [Nocardioides sp. C4-1]|uniref:hypothetical protein n=1 Tax=Nocardioides sp. C4-1 TaxID=3151851 RepID=UPI003267726A